MKPAVVLIGILILALGGFSIALAQSKPGAAPVARWEYGELSDTTIPAFRRRVASWYTPNQNVKESVERGGEGPLPMKKLFITLGGKDADYRGPASVFNLLGKDGWELVIIQHNKDSASEEDQYLFKRQIP